MLLLHQRMYYVQYSLHKTKIKYRLIVVLLEFWHFDATAAIFLIRQQLLREQARVDN